MVSATTRWPSAARYRMSADQGFAVISATCREHRYPAAARAASTISPEIIIICSAWLPNKLRRAATGISVLGKAQVLYDCDRSLAAHQAQSLNAR